MITNIVCTWIDRKYHDELIWSKKTFLNDEEDEKADLVCMNLKPDEELIGITLSVGDETEVSATQLDFVTYTRPKFDLEQAHKL